MGHRLHGFDVIVIGGGQAALSMCLWLRRTGRSFLTLDAEEGPAGAWWHQAHPSTFQAPAVGQRSPGSWLYGDALRTASCAFATTDEAVLVASDARAIQMGLTRMHRF